jgi:hypothetical protein
MLEHTTIVELKDKVKAERNLEFTKDEIKDIIYTVYSLGVINDKELNDAGAIFDKVDFNLLRLEYDKEFDEVEKYVNDKHKEYYGDKK